MNKTISRYPRILAIAPSRVGLGFARIEALNTLADCGVKNARKNKNAASLAHAGRLIDLHQPEVIVLENSLDTKIRRYAYDAANRLLSATNFTPNNSIIAAYTLTLDSLGNHLQETHEQPLFPILPNQTNNFSYSADNQLHAIDGQSVRHNQNGDLTGIGTNTTYNFDFDDRLTQFTETNISGSFTYDGLGNRASRVINGVSRRFVLDRSGALPQMLVETDTNGSPVSYYIYGIGLAQRISNTGTADTYHFNIQGSTIALSDAAGNVTDSYAYDSFGVLANAEGNSSQPFHYIGKYGIIDDGGLLYARARYFSPQLGSFLTKDSARSKDANGQSLNRFIYALNNPLRFSDISGLSPIEGNFAVSIYSSSSSDRTHEGLIDWHPFHGAYEFAEYLLKKYNVPLRLETHVDTQFGGLRIGEYRITPGDSIDLNGVGKTLESFERAAKVVEIYSAYENTTSELASRGITVSPLIDAIKNAPQSIGYAFQNPDASIQALIEGFTSAAAASVRFASFGLIEAHGPEIQQWIEQRY